MLILCMFRVQIFMNYIEDPRFMSCTLTASFAKSQQVNTPLVSRIGSRIQFERAE